MGRQVDEVKLGPELNFLGQDKSHPFGKYPYVFTSASVGTLAVAMDTSRAY